MDVVRSDGTRNAVAEEFPSGTTPFTQLAESFQSATASGERPFV